VIGMKRIQMKLVCVFSALVMMASLDPGRLRAQVEVAGTALIAGEPVNTPRPTDAAPEKTLPGESRIRIGPGDLLAMTVFDVPEMNQVVRVNDSGDASFSLIGNLHLAGLTADEAQSAIAVKLKDGNYVLNPQVSLLIREYNTQGVSVVGEVKKPGVYNVLGSQSLLDVIAAAGGTTPFAGPEVTIKRGADGSTVAVRLTQDAQASLASDVRLYPTDKVIVPRSGLVYVLGDVGRPGGFVMENDGKLTLLEALAMAGGSNRTASLGHAVLIRKTATGYTEVPIVLKKIVRGDEPAPQLQTEDILYVPNSAAKSVFTQQVPSVVSAAAGATVYHSIP